MWLILLKTGLRYKFRVSIRHKIQKQFLEQLDLHRISPNDSLFLHNPRNFIFHLSISSGVFSKQSAIFQMCITYASNPAKGKESRKHTYTDQQPPMDPRMLNAVATVLVPHKRNCGNTRSNRPSKHECWI